MLRPGWILVRNHCSLVSAGTERAKADFGSMSILAKARSRPDLVRKVASRARVEGASAALRTARERLEALRPIGYSSVGTVVAVGAGVEGVKPGDRVVCAGEGWASHAEFAAVPRNLSAVVPESVAPHAAAYATVGAIALHGLRQGEVTVGERVAVIGLGLVGQLAVRLLAASGCTAYGVDIDARAVELAQGPGVKAYARTAPSLEANVLAGTGGDGVDAVLICAATRSTDPMDLAVRLARDRGRIVVVGDVPVRAARSDLYEKELELRIARSLGPGRYDRDYEERGRDLPIGYVRWTEQRNLQAFVELVGTSRLDPTELTTHRFSIDEAPRAFELLAGGEAEERPFGIVIEYPEREEEAPPAVSARRRVAGGAVRIGLVGAGAFTRSTLLPALREANASFAAVASEHGLSAADVARRFGFSRAVQSAKEVLEADDVDAVVIATRHGDHAALAAAALEAGKTAFVEKPLALDFTELELVRAALASSGTPLMVGFNRRHAPLTEALMAAVPLVSTVCARVNAGPLPRGHWLHDPLEGGGRVRGEACHFVDLLSYLAASPVVAVTAAAAPAPGRALDIPDDIVATLEFASGTVGSLVYSGSGDVRLPKERIEVFGAGIAAVIDDFRQLETYAHGRRRRTKQAQDKGHRREMQLFVEVAAGRAEPPAAEPYLNSTAATLAVIESILASRRIEL